MGKKIREGWTSWMVFYIDPTLDLDDPFHNRWKTCGIYTGPVTAEEAIEKTAGKVLNQPFWAFAIGLEEWVSFYRLHYPAGQDKPQNRKIGPAGYLAIQEED